jgi:transcriptional regulator with XRE-family HTH domain
LAERAGLSHKFIGELERGRGNPTLTTLAALGDALGVELVDLLGIPVQRPRVSARQATLLREALVSMESLVEWAAPPETPPKRTRKR